MAQTMARSAAVAAKRDVETAGAVRINGYARPGFEAVRAAFVENFEKRQEVGAACCVFHRGEKVVDLWGGWRVPSTGEPWAEDTMALVYSSTKGLSGLAMALAHSRLLFDYDERVAAYWPEFAQNGKDAITVRQLLSHQAGLFALDERPTIALVSDLDRLAAVLARQRPAWTPGTRQGYHAITIGFYEGELLRRVDPKHRTLGQFFQEELATPLGLEVYIRLPEELPDTRLAPLLRFKLLDAVLAMPSLRFGLAVANPRSRLRRSLEGSELPEQTDRIYARNFEVPAGGGVATARGMAGAYAAFTAAGGPLALREGTVRELTAPARPPVRGFDDVCMGVPMQLSVGFMKPDAGNPFAHPSGFGAPGTGGSFAFADPHRQLAYAYVPNQLGCRLQDPRELALRGAMYRSVGVEDPYRG